MSSQTLKYGSIIIVNHVWMEILIYQHDCTMSRALYMLVKPHHFIGMHRCSSIQSHALFAISGDLVASKKIINLALEKNAFFLDFSMVDVWFMYCWDKDKMDTKDLFDVLFPESWGFCVTLHSSKYRDDITLWDGFLTFGCPPFTEGIVQTDEETLFGWRSITECIQYIQTKTNLILHCSQSIK